MLWDLIVIASSVSLVGMSVFVWVLDARNRKLRTDVATLYKTNSILLSNLKESFATNEVLVDRCVELSMEVRGIKDLIRSQSVGDVVN